MPFYQPLKIPPHCFPTDFISELKRKGYFLPNFSGQSLIATKPPCKRSLKHLHVCLGKRTAKVTALPEDFFQAPDWKPKMGWCPQCKAKEGLAAFGHSARETITLSQSTVRMLHSSQLHGHAKGDKADGACFSQWRVNPPRSRCLHKVFKQLDREQLGLPSAFLLCSLSSPRGAGQCRGLHFSCRCSGRALPSRGV